MTKVTLKVSIDQLKGLIDYSKFDLGSIIYNPEELSDLIPENEVDKYILYVMVYDKYTKEIYLKRIDSMEKIIEKNKEIYDVYTFDNTKIEILEDTKKYPIFICIDHEDDPDYDYSPILRLEDILDL